MSKRFFALAFALGLVTVAWVAWGFMGTHLLALAMTVVIAGVYLLGAWELRQFRASTHGLVGALAGLSQPPARLDDWLAQVPGSLRTVVRARIEGQARALPGPALTPYLVGLLVMLGMLGTFLGMVLTFKGAVFALEGSADLQALRGALAEPIKGLGLSFGTSVAGVAASAMLGLMSAMARRERLEAARQLDACVAGVLRPFSPAHQREASLQALQAQAGVLPQVLSQMEGLMARLDARSQQIDAQLLERHERLQRDTQAAYKELATSVGSSLESSLAAGARAAGETLTPVVSGAMAQVVQQSERLHARLGELGQAQVDALSQRFAASALEASQSWQTALASHERSSQALTGHLQATLTALGQTFEARSASLLAQVQAHLGELSQRFAADAQEVSQSWQAALASHERSSQSMAGRLQDSLQAFGQTFEERSASLLAQVQAHLSQAQSRQAEGEAQRLGAWTQSLQALAAEVQAQWQRAAEQALAQQQTLGQTLAQASAEVAERASEQARRSMDQATQLLDRSEELVRTRVQTEAQWQEQQGQRMAQLAQLWHSELAALRQAEDQRGQAAVDRLGALEAAVAQHLAQLGTSLEAPLTRLLQTASEVPQAAAGVITQLLDRSEELVRSRVQTEAQWHEQQGQRMAQLAQLWHTELAALREAEGQRGQAAVDRLGALEAAVAQHLAQLGASLEAPLSRLLQTASEVPQAAAGVITQLRQEMSRMAERDNLALEERTTLLGQLNELLQAVQASSGAQRQAVEALVDSAGTVMQQAGERFAQLLEGQAVQAGETAAQLGASAVELASLGEAFGQGVQQFQAGSDQLLDGLQRIEAALARSTARSDEQLAYYVAQARELIDLSISSQQGILESLHRLKAEPLQLLDEGARA